MDVVVKFCLIIKYFPVFFVYCMYGGIEYFVALFKMLILGFFCMSVYPVHN